MKQKIPTILTVLLFIAGLCILLYPTISSWINARNQTRAIQTYTEMVDELDAEELEAQWTLARQYNLRFEGQTVSSLEQNKTPSEYETVLNLGGTGVMGYIEIPVIGVYLPVYHGTGEKALQHGVGHVPETALPIGGEGFHAVLTGHRGVVSSDLFTDLDKIETGDVFFLHVLGETMAYQVDQITVVEPKDIAELLPVPGRDYVSLVTCTPYAVNSHRLLVRGVRVVYSPEAPVDIRTINSNRFDLRHMIIYIFLALWFLVAMLLLLTRKKPRRGNSRPAQKRRRRWIPPGVLMLTGIVLLLYPALSKTLYKMQVEKDFEKYLLDRSAAPDQDEPDPLLERLREYNQYLFDGGQEDGLKSPLAFEESTRALQELGYIEEILGYIQIPRMEIVLPIYAGGSQENMNRGAAHMTWTSFPVGGTNTNTCIIGHRNLARAEMFRNIDWLQTGDIVNIFIKWDSLEYTVVETAIVWPDETEKLIIQPGRDLLTLISCYPKGSNEQRYLVICERVP